MHPSLLPDELLAPVPPFEAYRQDVARLADRAPLGAADDVWLITAHALDRAAALPVAARAAVLETASVSVAAMVSELRPLQRPFDPTPKRALDTAAAAGAALGTIGRRLGGEPDAQNGAETDRALAALQRLAGEQERAGAFLLAFTMLGTMRDAAAPVLDGRQRGLLLTQQGRAARQLNAFDAASQLYEMAIRAAGAGRAPEVVARAQLGLGSLASMRGNYPAARTSFTHALASARRANVADLVRAAHHGLLCAALAARDADVALEHGWAAFAGIPDVASDARAEMLVNVANAGLQAGEHRAALGACLHALELTDVARIRLPALGTAVAAAARLGERTLLEHLTHDVERVVARSGVPYDNAGTLLEVAGAWALLGAPTAAEFAERAGALARSGGFHEIALRAEGIVEQASARRHRAVTSADEHVGSAAIAPRSPVPASVVRSPRAHAAVRAMEALPLTGSYAARAAS